MKYLNDIARTIYARDFGESKDIPIVPFTQNSQPKQLRKKMAAFYGAEELLENALIASDASGVYVYDDGGREYIDCVSGTFDQPLGHRHPAVIAAIKKQADELAYAASPFLGQPIIELADKLVEISPPNLTKVHLRDITGSTAIEGAIKIAQVATGKRDVITFFGSHHGQTMMTTEISGNAFRRAPYPVQSTGALQVPPANCFRCFYGQKYPDCGLRCVSQIEQFIEYASSGSVAAVVIEPVQGNGGNIMPPPGYFAQLRELCDKHGMLLIVDEVQTGMGRLGTMLASDYFDIKPNIVVLAKGLGGPAPRAAILLEEGLQKMPRYQHSSTGGSSLLSAASALATIEVLQQPGFLEGVRIRGAQLGEGLLELQKQFPVIGDVRGAGFMWGMEIVKPDGSPDVVLCNHLISEALNFGLILRSSRYGKGSVIKVRPPLVMTSREITEMLARIHHLFQCTV